MKLPIILAAMALALAMPARSATYAIDPTHTFASFEISHLGTSTSRGRFNRNAGSVQFDRAARSGSVDVIIETTSVSTGVAMLDKHLQSEDFLDAENFPTARFVGDAFSFNGDQLSQVSGMLTLRGKTLPVVLKATHFSCYTNLLIRREVCGGDFEATLRRSQWGLSYGLDFGIPDELRLLVQVEAIKQ
jgi:polyisoprenoid-binding protein YceI